MAEGLVKLRLESRLGDRVIVETPWAEPLGGDRYRVDNVPWFRGDVNWRDVVAAHEDVEGGFPLVREVVERSGHETLRILFDPLASPERQRSVLGELTGLGGSYEGTGAHREGVYAVDVEPGVDVLPLADVLAREAEQGLLGWRLGGDEAFLLALDEATDTANRTARHPLPLGDRAPGPGDELVMVDVSDSELAGGRRWEQLWARRLGVDRVAVRNAPWYAYELAVGDVCTVRRGAGRLPVLAGVRASSGRSTLRALLRDRRSDEELRDALHRLGARTERQPDGTRMLAADVPDDETANAVFDLLQEREDRGELGFETGWR